MYYVRQISLFTIDPKTLETGMQMNTTFFEPIKVEADCDEPDFFKKVIQEQKHLVMTHWLGKPFMMTIKGSELSLRTDLDIIEDHLRDDIGDDFEVVESGLDTYSKIFNLIPGKSEWV